VGQHLGLGLGLEGLGHITDGETLEERANQTTIVCIRDKNYTENLARKIYWQPVFGFLTTRMKQLDSCYDTVVSNCNITH